MERLFFKMRTTGIPFLVYSLFTLLMASLPGETCAQGSTLLYFAPTKADAGWERSFTLTNPGKIPVQAKIEAYNQGGKYLGVFALKPLDAQETRILESGIFPSGTASLKVEGSGILLGQMILSRTGSKDAENLPALYGDEASQQLDFPPLAEGDISEKRIVLLNPQPRRAFLSLSALDRNGHEIIRQRLDPLGPIESRSILVAGAIPKSIWAQVRVVRVTSDLEIMGYQLVNPEDGDLVGLTGLGKQRSGAWRCLMEDGGKGRITVVGVLNPGRMKIPIAVEAFDGSGLSLGIVSQETLSPGTVAFFSKSREQGEIPGNASMVKVSAIQPVIVYQVVAAGWELAAFLANEEENEASADFSGAAKERIFVADYAETTEADMRGETAGEASKGNAAERVSEGPKVMAQTTEDSQADRRRDRGVAAAAGASDNPVGPLPAASGFTMATVVGDTGLWTGAATARIPIELPSGPGGLAPNLALSYSSDNVVDATYKEKDKVNDTHNVQASAVGYGWEIEGIPVIIRVPAQKDFNDICWGYEVHLNGKRFRLAHRGGEGQVGTTRITRYESYPQNFIEAREYETYWENPLPDKRECTNYLGRREHKWVLKTADGSEYTFGAERDSRQEIQAPGGGYEQQYRCHYVCEYQCRWVGGRYQCQWVCGNRCGFETVWVNHWFSLTARWYVSRIRDTRSNEILFSYRRETAVDGTAQGPYDAAVTIDKIQYGVQNDPRFRVQFIPETSKRADCSVDGLACNGDQSSREKPVFRSEYLINRIEVSANTASGWVTLRCYGLEYGLVGNGGAAHSLLKKVSLKPNKESRESLPSFTMSYQNEGAGFDNWSPLISFENGYGGKTEFIYSPEFSLQAGAETRKRRRVETIKISERGNPVSEASYGYSGEVGSNYYSSSYGGGVHNGWYEFLGHREVTQTVKDGGGNTVRHVTTRFIQGTGLYRGADLEPHPARGQVQYQAVRPAAGSSVLQEVENVWNFVDVTVLPDWKSWNDCRCSKPRWGQLASTTERWNPGETGEAWRSSQYQYSIYLQRDPSLPACDPGLPEEQRAKLDQCTQYGNVTGVIETGSKNEYRRTVKTYVINRSGWIIDRVLQEQIFDAAGAEQRRTGYYYDRTEAGEKGALRAWGEAPVRGDVAAVHQVEIKGQSPDTFHEYWFDQYGNRIREKDPAGFVTTRLYDPIFHAFPTQEVNPKTHRTEWFTYGVNGSTPVPAGGFFGKLEKVRDPNGAETKYRYDLFGRLIRIFQPGDEDDRSASPKPSVEIVYQDQDMEPLTPVMRRTWKKTISDAAPWSSGGIWEREFFDGLGRLIQVQMPHQDFGGEEVVRFVTYNALGLKASEPAPYLKAAHVYNANCPDGNGHLTGRRCNPYVAPDPAKPQTRYTYDALGRVTETWEPDEKTVTRVQYRGLQTALIDANGHQKIQIQDAFGRLITVKEYKETYSEAAWEAGPYALTDYVYDSRDKLAHVCDAGFNRAGGAVCGANPSLSTIQIQYDSLGRKTGMRDADLGSWSYAYDAAGNLKRQTDARGQTICYYYDKLHRLKGKTYQKNNLICPADPQYANYAVKYFYDEADGTHGSALGWRTHTETTGPDKVIVHYRYDFRGRLEKESRIIGGVTYDNYFRYDALDRQIARSYPDGEWIKTAFNASGLPETLEYNLNGTMGWYVKDTAYNAAGQVKKYVLGNGFETRYGYFGYNAFGMGDGDDAPVMINQKRGPFEVGKRFFGRLARICTAGTGQCLPWPHDQPTTTALQDMSYWYDPAGNVKAVRNYPDQNRVLNLDYDHLDRLVRAYTRLIQTNSDPGGYDLSYGYNGIGNITRWGVTGKESAFGYQDPPHRHALTHQNNIQSFWYDANGNMIERFRGTPSQGYLEYDEENRLVSGRRGQQYAEKIVYDADGKQMKRIEFSWGTVAATTVYGGEHFEQKIVRQAVENLKYYLHGGKRLAMRRQNPGTTGKLYYLFADHLGSAMVTYHEGSGNIYRQGYFPWGGHFPYPQQILTDRQFTGQRYDSYLGIYDYGARYYDPAVGRFIQPDTIVPSPGNPADLNRYAYVRNNPLKYTDPSGHILLNAGAAIAGAAIGGTIGLIAAAGPQVIQNIQHGQPLNANLDPAHLARGFAVGAVAGAVSGATLGLATGWASTIAVGAFNGAVAGQVERAGENWEQGRSLSSGLGNWREMATDAAVGGATAGILKGGRIALGKFMAARGPALSGHGAWTGGYTTVPEGTTVTLPTRPGNSISDKFGNAIETGKTWNGFQNEMEGAITYLPGQTMPNPTLYPGWGLSIMGNPITVSEPTRLNQLIRPNMGHVKWAACLSIDFPMVWW